MARRQQNDHTVLGARPPATFVYHIKVKSSHCPFNAECQAGKLWMAIFSLSLWLDKGVNPGRPTARRTLLPLHHRSYHYIITAQSSVAEPQCTNIKSNQIFHYTRCNTPKCVTSLRAQLRVIAPGQHSFFGRNVAAMASRWQHCVRFERPEIWTSDLPLQRQTRYRSTNWPVMHKYR